MTTPRESPTQDRRCPVSGHAMDEGDRVYAEWYEPCQWWVLYHVKAEKIAQFEAETKKGHDHAAIRFSWCASADKPLPSDAIIFGEARPS